MVGQKFFVFGGGRWREINLSTGRVAGWGSVQYLSVRRGRLELARRNAVLRGLKALAAGKSTSAHDGPQLSQIRNIVTKSLEEPKPVNNVCQHHQHCCQRNIHCNTDANFNDILKPVTSTIAIQCTISKNAKLTETNLIEKPNQTTKKSNNTNNVKKIDTRNEKTAKRKRVSSASSDVFSSTDSQTSDTNRNLSTSLHQRVKLSQNKEPCKELFISEEDILLMRTFVENDDNNVFGVDLERFDSDDLYKRLIFYKLNPLVNVERSRKISELIRKKDGLSESFKDFIKNLGLQSVEEASQVSSKKYKMRARRKRPKIDSNGEEFDKENINKQIVLKKSRANGVLAEKVSQMVVTRNAKSMRIKSATGLVKGSKSRPASKKRNDLTDDIMNQNDLKKNKEVTIKAKNDRTNESVKINDDKNNETVKNNESSKQNNLMKRNKQNNESKLSKKKEIDMKNEANDKKNTVNKKSDKLKVNDKVISNELNNKETLSDSDAKLVTSDSEDDQNDKREKGKMPRLAVVPARRSYVSGGPHRQPYSTAEDAMLVQWVRGSGRARHVNGNKLWRELQPIFFKKMGRFRSWHSLRNRYLRYLLPTLGSMSLPSDEAARLRADAAAGEIKKIVPNSIYKEKRVISAWSRRPRSPLRKNPSPPSSVSPSPSISQPSPHSSSSNSSTRSHDSDYSMESVKSVGKWNFKKIGTKQEKIKRALRSSAVGSSPKRNKQKHINPRTPTYSELTKRFALKHSTPDSDSTGYNNTDKNVRPTRFSLGLRRKGATDRQVVEISDDERTTVRNNSKNNKNSNLNNIKKGARNISTDRQDADYSDDSRKAKQSRSVDRQNSKNNLNNSRKRTRLNSSDSDDQIKTKQSNSKNNSINKSRKSIRKNSTDRQDTDTNDNQTKTKQSYSKSNSLNKSRRSTRKKSTDRQDSDTNDELIKIKQSNSKNNNLNKSRRSTRKNSTDRQETDNDEQSKTTTGRQYSKNNKNNLNKSRKRARESSTEEQNTDSSDEKQFKQNNKTISSKSPNKSSNNRKESSDDERNQKSYRLRKSDRHNNKNNSINNSKQNNLNKNKRKSNKTSNESSDFEENSKQVKKLRSDKSKADTGRPKTRRLYNPKEF